MAETQLLKINIGKAITATPVDHIESDKPAVFIFEGARGEPYFTPYENRTDNQYLVKLAYRQCTNPENINFYTIKTDFYKNRNNTDFYKNRNDTVINYNAAPYSTTTPVSQDLARNIILPGLPDISHMQEAERTQVITQTKKRLSRQTAIGYSLGSALIQEITNALQEHLKQKGFTPAETKECMSYFSAATLGNTAFLTPKNFDITQLHSFIAGDKHVTNRNAQNLSTSKDPHPHSHINGQMNTNNLTIVCSPVSPEGENALCTYAIKLTAPASTYHVDKISPEERSEHSEVPADWATRVLARHPVRREVESNHDLFLYANVDAPLRHDLTLYGFNPGANIYWETVNRFVTSAATGYGNEGYQPPSNIIQQIQKEFLSPEGKEAAMRKVQNSIRNFQTGIA